MKTLRGRHLLVEPLHASATKDEIYYHLSPTAQAALRLPEKFGRPIPIERRVHAYAVLLFCTSDTAPRPLFTLEEFQRAFPMTSLEETGGAGRFFARSYFLDTDQSGARRLGRILVDEGAKTETLVEKCRKAYDAAEIELPLFVHERRFALTVITAAPEKKRRLEHELRRTPVGPPDAPLRVSVALFPELALLQMAKETNRGAA